MYFVNSVKVPNSVLFRINNVGPHMKITCSVNSVTLEHYAPGNERFMNVLSKRNSVHLRMTHVQFVHVHFLTPTPQRSFSSFISFSSVQFISFISFISFIFSRRLRWYDCGSIKVAFCTSFYFLDVFLIIQLSSFSSRLNLPFVHSVHQPFGNLSAFIQFVHCGSLKIFT